MANPVSPSRGFVLLALTVLFGLSSVAQTNNSPQDLADRFELPPGFHIYRAAGPELSGGSYALTFDGEGRLLVGDGNAVDSLSVRNITYDLTLFGVDNHDVSPPGDE